MQFSDSSPYYQNRSQYSQQGGAFFHCDFCLATNITTNEKCRICFQEKKPFHADEKATRISRKIESYRTIIQKAIMLLRHSQTEPDPRPKPKTEKVIRHLRQTITSKSLCRGVIKPGDQSDHIGECKGDDSDAGCRVEAWLCSHGHQNEFSETKCSVCHQSRGQEYWYDLIYCACCSRCNNGEATHCWYCRSEFKYEDGTAEAETIEENQGVYRRYKGVASFPPSSLEGGDPLSSEVETSAASWFMF